MKCNDALKLQIFKYNCRNSSFMNYLSNTDKKVNDFILQF